MLTAKTKVAQERYNKVTEIFLEALDYKSTEWADFLLKACAGDDELKVEVEKFLKNSVQAEAFLNSPLVNLHPLATALIDNNSISSNLIGTQIGKYTITNIIGQGGMGIVYEAIRNEVPNAKPVAIKVLSMGINSKNLLARFRLEYEVMANLEHPYIARLLDGDVTNEGQPYLVMELINGQPIDKYCQSHNLNITQRLKLFSKVCLAVQHAHLNLVVHRDLKPSNILVTSDGTPKLLDFGIAKIIKNEGSYEDVKLTQTGAVIMTPAYASPEQILGKPITVSVDIYALGILLYKILTGYLPYEITSNCPKDIEKIICEYIPVKPSVIVRQDQKDYLNNYSKEKERKKRAKKLSGDLDNIVLMALRKEQKYRYSSVTQFAQDIQYYLEGFPVIAQKNVFKYKTVRFIQRNGYYLLISSLLIILLVSGITSTLWQAKKAEEQKVKVTLQGKLLAVQSELATARSKDIRDLTSALLFQYNDSLEKMAGATALREQMIAEALKYLDRLSNQPNIDSEIQHELALAYQRVGDLQGRPFRINTGNSLAALESYERSLKLFEELTKLNPNDLSLQEEFSVALERKGEILDRLGNSNLAINYYRRACSIHEHIANLNPTNQNNNYSLGISYTRVANVLQSTGDFIAAMELYCKAIKIYKDLLSKEPTNENFSRRIAVIYTRFIGIYESLNDLITQNTEINNKAIKNKLLQKSFYYNQLITKNAKSALSKEKENPFLKSELAGCYMQNSAILRKTKQTSQSMVLLKEAVFILNKLVKDDINNKQYPLLLAESYKEMGKLNFDNSEFKLAINFHKKAEKILQESLIYNSSDVMAQYWLADLNNLLATSYIKTKDINRADKYLTKSFDLYKNLIVKDSSNIDFQLGLINTLNKLTTLLIEEGQEDRATKILEETLKHYQEVITKEPSAIELSSYALLLSTYKFNDLSNQTLAIKYAQEASQITNRSNLFVLLNLSTITKNKLVLEEVQSKIEQLLKL